MRDPQLGFLGESGERGERGERAAFALFVEQTSPLVRSAVTQTLYRYSVPTTREAVEDLHNGLFVLLMEDDFRRLRQFQGRASLATYVRVITVRHVVDVLRQQRYHPSLDADPTAQSLADQRASPQEQLEQTEQARTVQRAIARLEPRERLLLTLVFDRELAPDRICGLFGITLSAYYNQKSRLLKKMRKMCEESARGPSHQGGRRCRD